MSGLIWVGNGEKEYLLNVPSLNYVSVDPDGRTLNLYGERDVTFLMHESETGVFRDLAKLWAGNQDWLELRSRGGLGQPLPKGPVFVNRRALRSVTREHDMDLLWILRFWFNRGDPAVMTFPGPHGEQDSLAFMQRLKG